ncbi:MAG: hypothetical protein FWC45_06350, partial [Treponema sp.]|nr:hypothetical protein [Treponema sp.]
MNVEFLHTRLSLRARFVIAFLFYALAALLQILMVRGGGPALGLFRFAGVGLFVIPLWFLKARSVSNKPGAGKTKADKARKTGSPGETGMWKPVSMTDLDRLRDRIGAIRKAKIPAVYSVKFGIPVTFPFVFLLFVAGFIIGAAGAFAVIDLYLVFFPFFWFARVEKWVPGIGGKIDVFGPVLEAKLPETLRLDVMLFFGEAGGVPSDIRLMLAPGPGAPKEIRDELLGAQFQVTYNTGPNGEVPYVYAVFITKGQGKIWQSLQDSLSRSLYNTML